MGEACGNACLCCLTDRTAIQVGDLVQVVRPQSCGCSHSLGSIFVVTDISGGPNVCSSCNHQWLESLDAWQEGFGWAAEIFTLKRIPPLSDLEGIKTDEPIKEPA